MMIKQKIDSEYIKLDQMLKLIGVVQTGGQAKSVILNGEVLVNQEVCKSRGKKLYNGDIVKYKDEVIEVLVDVN